MSIFDVSPDSSGSTTIVVAAEHTAPHVGSGEIAVLATPVMVNLMEAAALDAVENQLPAGHQSLGIHLSVSHVAATPIGMRVHARAELIEIDGRRLRFKVSAEDEQELIGEGTHERVIVNVGRFDLRVQEKTDSLDPK